MTIQIRLVPGKGVDGEGTTAIHSFCRVTPWKAGCVHKPMRATYNRLSIIGSEV